MIEPKKTEDVSYGFYAPRERRIRLGEHKIQLQQKQKLKEQKQRNTEAAKPLLAVSKELKPKMMEESYDSNWDIPEEDVGIKSDWAKYNMEYHLRKTSAKAREQKY